MKVRGSEFQLPARKSFGANCVASTLTLPLSLAKEGRPIRAREEHYCRARPELDLQFFFFVRLSET